jgi:hypothetical protein
MSLAEASIALRNRMILSLLLGCVAGAILVPMAFWLRMLHPGLIFAVAALCVLEVIGYDCQLSLNSIRQPVLANLLYFFRSAAWVPVVFVAHFVFHQDVSLEAIFELWIVSSLIGFAAAAVLLRHWAGSSFWTAPVSIRHYATVVKKGWYIYINDLSNALSMNIDRYIVVSLLGLREVGAYSFFWAFANAASSLTATGVIQTEAPDLVKARAIEDATRKDWIRLVHRFMRRVAAYGSVLCGASAICAYAAAVMVKGEELRPYLWLSGAMAGYQILAVLAAGLGLVLFSARDDKFIAGSNIAMVVVYILLLPMAAIYGGLVGIVALITLSNAALLAGRASRVWSYLSLARE